MSILFSHTDSDLFAVELHGHWSVKNKMSIVLFLFFLIPYYILMLKTFQGLIFYFPHYSNAVSTYSWHIYATLVP